MTNVLHFPDTTTLPSVERGNTVRDLPMQEAQASPAEKEASTDATLLSLPSDLQAGQPDIGSQQEFNDYAFTKGKRHPESNNPVWRKAVNDQRYDPHVDEAPERPHYGPGKAPNTSPEFVDMAEMFQDRERQTFDEANVARNGAYQALNEHMAAYHGNSQQPAESAAHRPDSTSGIA